MKKLLILLLTLIACSDPLLAQVDTADSIASRPVTTSITVGLGQAQVRNTYLTPLLYSGTGISVGYDRMRQWKRLGRWMSQQRLDGQFTTGEDKGAHGENWSARFRYRYAAHYQWHTPYRLTLMAGPYLSAETGFDYNLKMGSGNNPATARLATNAGLSLMGSYRYRVLRRASIVRLQLQAPLLGYALMPEYGASYYETFYLTDGEGSSHFTSLHNQQDLDVRLMTDVPVFPHHGGALRLGIAYHIETMDINQTINRFSSLEAVVGWTFQYIPSRSIHFNW